MWPGATVVVLTAFIARTLWWMVSSLSVRRFGMRSSFDRWWMLLIQGLISTVFGVWAFINPLLSLLYIVISVSLWMFFAAIVQFMLARAHKVMGTSPAWSIFGGVPEPRARRARARVSRADVGDGRRVGRLVRPL